jgi:hypothetical protein
LISEKASNENCQADSGAESPADPDEERSFPFSHLVWIIHRNVLLFGSMEWSPPLAISLPLYR